MASFYEVLFERIRYDLTDISERFELNTNHYSNFLVEEIKFLKFHLLKSSEGKYLIKDLLKRCSGYQVFTQKIILKQIIEFLIKKGYEKILGYFGEVDKFDDLQIKAFLKILKEKNVTFFGPTYKINLLNEIEFRLIYCLSDIEKEIISDKIFKGLVNNIRIQFLTDDLLKKIKNSIINEWDKLKIENNQKLRALVSSMININIIRRKIINDIIIEKTQEGKTQEELIFIENGIIEGMYIEEEFFNHELYF